jgi:hypothetical protein
VLFAIKKPPFGVNLEGCSLDFEKHQAHSSKRGLGCKKRGLCFEKSVPRLYKPALCFEISGIKS